MTRRYLVTGLVFGLALLLGACGGEEEGGKIPMPDTGIEQPTPEPVEQLTPEEIQPHIDDLITVSDARIDTIVTIEDTNAWWDVDIVDSPAETSVTELMLSDGEFHAPINRQGVSTSLAESEGAFDYAGWLDRSFFLVSVYESEDDSLYQDYQGVLEVDLYSFGEVTGTNPISGSASWLGVMAGVDISETSAKGNLIEGDARINIADFSDPSVNVAFTNITDSETGVVRANMIWSDLALENGLFNHNGDLSVSEWPSERRGGLNSLTGQFYGASHEEVGGVFVRDEVVGAFGGKR